MVKRIIFCERSCEPTQFYREMNFILNNAFDFKSISESCDYFPFSVKYFV